MSDNITQKKCGWGKHQWEIIDKVETKGWFGSTTVTILWRCKCGSTKESIAA